MTFSPRPPPNHWPIGRLESNRGVNQGQYTYVLSSDGVEVRHPLIRQRSEGFTRTQTHSPLPTTNKHPLALMEATTHHNSNIKEASSSQDSRPLALRRGKSPPHLDLSFDIIPYNQAKEPVVTATEISWNDNPYGGVNKAYDIIQQIGHDSEGPVSTSSPLTLLIHACQRNTELLHDTIRASKKEIR